MQTLFESHATRDVESPAVEPKKPLYIGVFASPLGQIDADCTNPACLCSLADILDEVGREWVIACWICGRERRMPAVPGYLTPREEEFRFRDGRFSGKTLAETDSSPRGREYIAWAAVEHKRPAVRAACKTHIDGLAAAR